MDFTDLMFFVNVTWLLIHELDAIAREEWRFFFAPLGLDEVTAYRLFVALHLPLIVMILWLSPGAGFQIVFSLFLIFHAALHALLRNHPRLQFDNWFSALWIYGAVPLAFSQILLVLLG